MPVDQRGDLSRQSTSSHYLFLAPAMHGRTLPCVPAILVSEIQDRDGPIGVVQHLDMASAGKSLAAWLLEDVVGLRCGDADLDVLAKARGRPGRRPRALLEVSVELDSRIPS